MWIPEDSVGWGGCHILGRILAAAEVIYDFSFCKCLNLNINILPSPAGETYEQRLYLFHLPLFAPDKLCNIWGFGHKHNNELKLALTGGGGRRLKYPNRNQ